MRRLRSLLVPVPFAAGAVAAGGVPGVLLGFFAALLWLDRLLDHFAGASPTTQMEAERAFRRLARERRGPDLTYLPLDAGWAALAARHPHGVEPIGLDSIVGSVDAHKASTFDRSFRPPGWSRGRWTLMYRAVARGTDLPPIAVVRIGGEHYVQDGHHRVSVARVRGSASIEADVLELVPQTGAPAR